MKASCWQILSFVLLLTTTYPSLAVPSDSDVANLDTLELVQVIIRHGARAPISPYPTDPFKNQSLYWPDGWAELTKLGFQQQLQLGQYLRHRYDGFLPRKYNHYEFIAQSSDVDRAIQSAEVNLAGLYQFDQNGTTDLRSGETTGWQAIPIHTIPEDTDIWINDRAVCPRYIQLYDEFYSTNPEIQTLTDENIDFLRFISEKSGLREGLRVNEVFQVQDALRTEKIHNLALPDWVTKNVTEKLDYFKALSFSWKLKTKEMKRLRSGPLIGKLIENFKIKADASANLSPEDSPFQNQAPFRKMHFFSGHDSTIAGVLNTWNIFDNHIPPFAAALLLELHKSPNSKETTVEIYYRNDTTKELYSLKIPECGTPCFLSKLTEISKEYIPTDWDQECKVNLLGATPPLETIDSVDPSPSEVLDTSPGPSLLGLAGIGGAAMILGAGVGSALFVALKRWQVSHVRGRSSPFGPSSNIINYETLA